MAYTYELICEELKLNIWIGQGYDFTSFYSDEAGTMEDLHDFLRCTRGYSIRVVGESELERLDEESGLTYRSIASFKRCNPHLDWIYPPNETPRRV